MILIKWVQRGHTTHDPTNQNTWSLEACWERSPTDSEAAKQAAEDYAAKQPWESYEICQSDKSGN